MHAVLLDAFSKSIGTVRSVLNVREKGLSERKVREKGLGRTADRRATVRRCVRCPNCMCFWRAPTTPAPPPPVLLRETLRAGHGARRRTGSRGVAVVLHHGNTRRARGGAGESSSATPGGCCPQPRRSRAGVHDPRARRGVGAVLEATAR